MNEFFNSFYFLLIQVLTNNLKLINSVQIFSLKDYGLKPHTIKR
jgi:hypothetical protein